MILTEFISHFPGGHERTGYGYSVYCPLHTLWLRTVDVRPGNGCIMVEPRCGCRVEDILTAVKLSRGDLYTEASRHTNAEEHGTGMGTVSTGDFGVSSGRSADFGRAGVGGRFGKGNPYRWKPGESGNPRGRRRVSLEDDFDFRGRMVDLIAEVHELRQRFPFKRDSRFERFKVIYELTGNAFKSARIAGYAPKTARSKGYLLARRARQSAGMG